MKKLILLTLVFVFTTTTSNLQAIEPTSQPIPQVTASTALQSSDNDIHEHTESPIKINVSLEDKVRKESGWNFLSIVQVILDVHTDKSVEVSSELFKVSDDMYRLESVGNKKLLYSKKLGYRVPENVNESFQNLQAGQYKLVYTATSVQDDSFTYGGYEETFFTITANDLKGGWQSQIPHFAPAVTSAQDSIANFISPNSPNYGKTDTHVLNQRDLNSPKVKLTGRWRMFDRTTSLVPLGFAKVEMRYQNPAGTWFSVGTAFTDQDGEYTIFYNQIKEYKRFEIRVYFQNQYVSVVDKDSNVYYLNYQTNTDLREGGQLDTLEGQSKNFTVKVAWIFNDIVKTYQFLSRYKQLNLPLKVKFYPGADLGPVGNNYDRTTQTILLNDNGPNFATTVMHEAAHHYMNDNYNGSYPTTSCSRGNHVMNGETEPGCAWTEGWAHFIALVVNGSSILTYPDGTKWDLENTSNYAFRGDTVEGRVAGALWDLYDLRNDGLDVKNYLFTTIYRAMYSARISNFEEYWKNWLKEKYDKEASVSLWQNRIEYYSYEMLLPDMTQYVNGESVKVFAIEGYNGYPIIRTHPFIEKVDTKIEIFSDIYLTRREAVDDDSAGDGYSLINNHKLFFGRTYYLKVTHVDGKSPVYAKVDYTATKEVDLDNEILTPEKPGYVNGEKYRLFKVKGNGKNVQFFAERFGLRYDIVLEFAEETQNRGPINPVNDVDGPIIRKLEVGKTYVLFVRNYNWGRPVGAKVTMKEF